MSTASSSSPTRVLSLDDLHLLQRSVTRLEDSTVAQEASSVSPPLGMSSSVLPSLPCLPHPNNNTHKLAPKHDLQLHYQRPKAHREMVYTSEKEREKKKEKLVGCILANKGLNSGKESKDKTRSVKKTSKNQIRIRFSFTCTPFPSSCAINSPLFFQFIHFKK